MTQDKQSEQLEQQLQHWYAQSKATQPLPAAIKQQFVEPTALHRLWQWSRAQCSFRRLQALSAVIVLGLVWQLWFEQQMYYQISQSSQADGWQIHQLSSESQSPSKQAVSSVQGGAAGAAAAQQRQTLYAQRYQDYVAERQQIEVMQQLIVSRLPSANGMVDWQLVSCQQLRLQLTADWLTQFKQQQQWTEQHWQQLADSRWLRVSTGKQGQILNLQASAQPPACAP